MQPTSTLDPTTIKALIFDVDGTLSDSDDRMVESLFERLLFLRGLVSEEKLQKFSRWFIHFAEGPGNWLLEIADRMGFDHLLARFFDWRANSRTPVAHHFPLIPGITPMLEAVVKRYPIAVVTARNEVTTSLFLQLNDLESFFPIVISSQTCEKTKPFPDPLLHAARKMNVPIENCLMIGDTVTDVRAALAAGAQSLSVLCGFGTEDELRRAGTHAILTSTSLLSSFLLESHLGIADEQV